MVFPFAVKELFEFVYCLSINCLLFCTIEQLFVKNCLKNPKDNAKILFCWYINRRVRMSIIAKYRELYLHADI